MTNPIKVQAQKLLTSRYSAFTGVDFTSDVHNVANHRFAYAENIINDDSGFPEKRLGHRTMIEFNAPVYGLFTGLIGGNEVYLAHAGSNLYLCSNGYTDIIQTLCTNIEARTSRGFFFDERFYLLDGKTYRYYDGINFGYVRDIAYVPSTTINSPPAGGGMSFEDVNLLTEFRLNTFVGDGTSTDFKLDVENLVFSSGIEVKVQGALVAKSAYSIIEATGKVRLNVAPPNGGGISNVEIKFRHPLNINIAECTFFGQSSYGNGNYFFFSGHPDHPSRDWRSDISDPTYFPSLKYSVYGDASRVMGYASMRERLFVFKEANPFCTVFVRTPIEIGDEVQHQVMSVSSCVGTIAHSTIMPMSDEILTLTSSGVFGLSDINTSGKEVLRERSHFVNGKLLSKSGLGSAVACVWRGMYLLCVGEEVYILDGRQRRVYDANDYGNYAYECAYWTNVPAACLLSYKDELYFGTIDGKLKKFNSDLVTLIRFDDDDSPVHAVAHTKLDDDGDFMVLKTLAKNGTGLMVKPYTKSSVRVYVSAELPASKKLAEVGETNISATESFTFELIDFCDIDFSSMPGSVIIPFGTKLKKYIALQFVLENAERSEGFGIYGLVKRFYATGQTVKKTFS